MTSRFDFAVYIDVTEEGVMKDEEKVVRSPLGAAQGNDEVQDWLLCRPAGGGPWLVLGASALQSTWDDLRSEAKAQQEYAEGHPLEVRISSMTSAEVEELDEFGGW